VAVSRADQKISSEDIDRVIAAAKIFPISRNREIVDAFPREFIIDGVGGIRDPLDMQGIRFEADVMIVEVFSQYIKNTTQAILDSNVRVNDLIPGVLSSAQSVLEPNEKERGVAILDIGAGTTSLAVFEENTLLHIAIFPIGSNNITNDIAIGLKCDIDTAEKIKIEFGSAINSKGDTKKEKAISQEGEEIIFTKTALRRIINARVCEIFEVVNEELKKISKDRLLPAGVVLTGGGSSLPGISDLARKELKLPARVGFAKRFNPLIDDPRFSVVCGLAMIGYEIEEEEEGSWSKAKRKINNFFKSLIP
jgi:cell division protein FtsA